MLFVLEMITPTFTPLTNSTFITEANSLKKLSEYSHQHSLVTNVFISELASDRNSFNHVECCLSVLYRSADACFTQLFDIRCVALLQDISLHEGKSKAIWCGAFAARHHFARIRQFVQMTSKQPFAHSP
jgi:hypothetical protein